MKDAVSEGIDWLCRRRDGQECQSWSMGFLRYGRRAHALGGSLHEVAIGDRIIVSLSRHYDHIDDLHFGGFLIFATPTQAIGARKGEDYVRLYLGAGTMTVAMAEDDEFDQLYTERR